jgi:hypothetical protein
VAPPFLLLSGLRDYQENDVARFERNLELAAEKHVLKGDVT